MANQSASAYQAWIFDNSGAKPRLIGTKAEGVIALDPDALPEVIAAVTSLTSENSGQSA